MKRILVLASFVVSLGVIGALPAHAQTYTTNLYVSVSGNDTNPGTQAAPYKTIQKAVTAAQPGTVIYVNPGTYAEHVSVSGKIGTQNTPISIVGNTTDPAQYPVIDGGDPGYTGGNNPAFKITSSTWITFERLKVINSSTAAFLLERSSYIVFRRNIVDFHKYGVYAGNSNDTAANASHHILMEYNELYQSYGRDKTWPDIKASKWEGGAYVSGGGGGMIEIRYNYIHDSFNAVYMYRQDNREFKFSDSNIFVHDNRFEYILDDPFEPDQSYAFNDHFYNNILVNTHRLVSMASTTKLTDSASGALDPNLGPVYIYNNAQFDNVDVTNTGSAHPNGSFKVFLDSNTNYFQNGIYIFNNSVDESGIAYGYGVQQVGGSDVKNWYFYNNALKTSQGTVPSLTLVNSEAANNFGSKAINIPNVNGAQNTDPLFTNAAAENFTLTAASPAKAKSRAMTFFAGFTSSTVVPAGADAGVLMNGTCFAQLPQPVYVTPPGGDQFTTNLAWPSDTFGGAKPSFAPNGCNGVVPPTTAPTAAPSQTVPSATTNPAASPTTAASITPGASVSIAPSLTSIPCPLKTKGDADCDGHVNLFDLEIWRHEYIDKPPAPFKANFNPDSDAVVNLVDLEIWTGTFLGR